MNLKQAKDRILETSSIARRIYGVKLTLRNGPTDASRWFLFNCEKLKYSISFNQTGLVLDLGSYLGDYTEVVVKNNPQLTFWLYEPIPEFFSVCANKFHNKENIVVSQKAVSADGRRIKMQIDGLRSRQKSVNFPEGVTIDSISIQEIFDSVSEIQLVKMNIEGMEYECLEQLIRTNSLIKAKYLLIQFHNFEKDSQNRRDLLRKQMARDFEIIYTFEWMWELWIRKEE
jgi:FkbM family methyltransferase